MSRDDESKLGTSKGLWFLSPQNGLEFENSPQATQRRSNDGGKTWKPESRCGVDASVGGLPRNLPCLLHAAHFLSPTVGFAGGGAATDMAKYAEGEPNFHELKPARRVVAAGGAASATA